jgi:hypothetical protein
MRSWLALVLAPVAALGVLGFLDYLAGPSCASGDWVGLHVAAAAGLLVAVVLGAVAAGEWAMHRREPGAAIPEGERRARRHVLAMLGTSVAALSAVVILVTWVSFWLLPCAR